MTLCYANQESVLNHGHNKIGFGLSLPKIKINWSPYPYFSYDVPLLLFLIHPSYETEWSMNGSVTV